MGIETLTNRDRHLGVIHQNPQHRHEPQQQQTIHRLIQRADLAEHIARYSQGSLPQNMGSSPERFHRQEGISLSLPQPWLNYSGGRSPVESAYPIIPSSNLSEPWSESTIQRSESTAPSIKPSFDRPDANPTETRFLIRRAPLGELKFNPETSHHQESPSSGPSLPLNLPPASAPSISNSHQSSPDLSTSPELSSSTGAVTTLYRLADVSVPRATTAQATATSLDSKIATTKPLSTPRLQASRLQASQIPDQLTIAIPQPAQQTSSDPTAPTQLKTTIITPQPDNQHIRRSASPLKLSEKPSTTINISRLATAIDRPPSPIQSHPTAMPLVQSPIPPSLQIQRNPTPLSNPSLLASSLPLAQTERIMRVETNGSDALPPIPASNVRSEVSSSNVQNHASDNHPAILAEQVSRIIARQLIIERERRGIMP